MIFTETRKEDVKFNSYKYPTEIITDKPTKKSETIDIIHDKKTMKTRSFRFPRKDEKYTDTTYYDNDNMSLDIAYQCLRRIDIKAYPNFSTIKLLYIDHNKLESLPDPSYLPNIEHLDCSSNQLRCIPFYPNLSFINASANKLLSCKPYDQSEKLLHADFSYNNEFKLDCVLSKCEHLSLTDCNIKNIDIGLLPMIKYLDVSNNELKNITGQSDTLIELCVNNNMLSCVEYYPNLEFLMINNNVLRNLRTFPVLKNATMINNKIEHINRQPNLVKLDASYNRIKSFDDLPKLNIVNFSWNRLENIAIHENMEYVDIHFNSIKNISFPQNISKLKELKVGFDAYKIIYEKYYSLFDSVDVQFCVKRFKYMFSKLEKIFTKSIGEYLGKKFMQIDFSKRHIELRAVSRSVYCKMCDIKITDWNMKYEKSEYYEKIHNSIVNFYHKTLIIVIYFNGYYN